MPRAKKAKSDLLSLSPEATGGIDRGPIDPYPAPTGTIAKTLSIKTLSFKSRSSGHDAAHSAIVVACAEAPTAPQITACGQRFAVHQIGSMFGRE